MTVYRHRGIFLAVAVIYGMLSPLYIAKKAFKIPLENFDKKT